MRVSVSLRLEIPQRLRNRHLINQHLVFVKRRLRNTMARLDDGGVGRVGRGLHAGGLGEELSDRHGIGGVVGALIDDLENV